MSGYVDCACPNCFEIAISSDDAPSFCGMCEDAGCDGESDCCVDWQECPECGDVDGCHTDECPTGKQG